MGLFDRLFRGAASGSVDLDLLMPALHHRARALLGPPPATALLHARLGDLCRSFEQLPPLPAALAPQLDALDEMARQRMALAAATCGVEPLSKALAARMAERDGRWLIEEALLGLAQATERLDLQLIYDGPLRIEEFSRHLLARLGLAVKGEAAEASQARLEQIDYASLLAAAEQAHEGAADRREYLQKLQDALDARYRPRGKW